MNKFEQFTQKETAVILKALNYASMLNRAFFEAAVEKGYIFPKKEKAWLQKHSKLYERARRIVDKKAYASSKSTV